jgi:hypothetical protein
MKLRQNSVIARVSGFPAAIGRIIATGKPLPPPTLADLNLKGFYFDQTGRF